ncbi:Uncharacterised protein [Mycobacteroides abscessus subsp. abscessus]|nr:Uncharacterised protein [Mycobacteroides abscessus subsp. abscessus]
MHATSPIGTLTKKIARQPQPNRSPVTSSPPSTGPNMAASPATAP